MDKDSIKELLQYRLAKKNINISSIELDEIMDIYDNILCFLLELTGEDTSYVNELNNYLIKDLDEANIYEIAYYNFFSCIAILKKKESLKYLDYIYIMRYIYGDVFCAICDINSYLSGIINDYVLWNEEVKYEEFDFKANVINKMVINTFYDKIMKSRYLPSDYKNIITIYKKIFDNYGNINNYDGEIQQRIDYMLTTTYYYFIYNDSFNNDSSNVLDFLTYLYHNLLDIVDKFSLLGIRNSQDMYNYINNFYNNYKKEVKVIK